jgi:hypothetical protein
MITIVNETSSSANRFATVANEEPQCRGRNRRRALTDLSRPGQMQQLNVLVFLAAANSLSAPFATRIPRSHFA